MESAIQTQPSVRTPASSTPQDRPIEIDAPRIPSVHHLTRAIAGFALLGLVAGLGSGDGGVASRTVPSGLFVGGGALMLTGPALLVVHQYLGLEASPDALMASLASAFAKAGDVALGLIPTMLLFSATSGLWAVVFGILLTGLGLFGLDRASTALIHSERAAMNPLKRRVDLMILVVMGWSGLTLLIALRIAWDVLRFAGGVA